MSASLRSPSNQFIPIVNEVAILKIGECFDFATKEVVSTKMSKPKTNEYGLTEVEMPWLINEVEKFKTYLRERGQELTIRIEEDHG